MRRLTENEIEVMKVLWEECELKPSEIEERFPMPIKNSALRSYLSFLLDKGHVERRWRNGAYYYRAITNRDSAFKDFFRRMADSFFEGSTDSLVCHLLKTEDLSDETLLELRELLKESEGDSRDA